MNATDAVGYLVTGLVSAGGYKAVTSLWTARTLARKASSDIDVAEAKLPAEVDSVVVQGAEKAVLVMSRALDTATAENAQLRAQQEDDRRTIADLQRRVLIAEEKASTAQRAAGAAQAAASDAQSTVSALREQLERVVTERDRRQHP